MKTQATLKLDDGAEPRVELGRDDLVHQEILVRRTTDAIPPTRDLVEWADEHLKTAARHPAGTTDRFLAADRDRTGTISALLTADRQLAAGCAHHGIPVVARVL